MPRVRCLHWPFSPKWSSSHLYARQPKDVLNASYLLAPMEHFRSRVDRTRTKRFNFHFENSQDYHNYHEISSCKSSGYFHISKSVRNRRQRKSPSMDTAKHIWGMLPNTDTAIQSPKMPLKRTATRLQRGRPIGYPLPPLRIAGNAPVGADP